jgi:hypothetical protein
MFSNNNVFKIVYDNWENNNPIPNGLINSIGLKPYLFNIPYNIFNLLEKSNYEIKNIKLEDVGKNSFYIIKHDCLLTDMIRLNKWILTDLVEEKVKTKNLKIVFLNLHESLDNIEIELKKLQEYIFKKGLKEENFYVLNNNSNLYEVKNNLKTNINVFKTNWLIEYICNSNLKDTKLIEDKKFIFLLHNRIPKAHRISLLILLKKFNLLENDIIDWSLTYQAAKSLNALNLGQNMVKTGMNYNVGSKCFLDIHSKELRPIYKELIMTTKLSYYENDKNWFNGNIGETHDSKNFNELKSFEQSYINIITESHYSETDFHISEKSFRPFYCFQLPIFLSSYKHVSKIKEEHPSLHLFDDLIDHSYDNEKHYIKRLEMVANEIKRLSEMRDVISDYYIKNKTKLIENRNYIDGFSNNKSTVDYFKSLINNDTV